MLKIFIFLFVFVSSGFAQITDRSVEQLNSLYGQWLMIDPISSQLDTLELDEGSHYIVKSHTGMREGEWSLLDLSHLTLDNDHFRFFFKGTNLVLQDNAGNQREYRNSQPNSGEPFRQVDGRISQFVRRIYQDQQGNLWLGTNGDGVIRYNGDTLEYFSLNQGFGGLAVRGIVGDSKGNIWFGTERGVTLYNGTSFTNFTEKDGLVHNDVWSIIVDTHDKIWIGTYGGACVFDGKTFNPFNIPESEIDSTRGVSSKEIIHCIMEDRQGNIWFGNNGGAYKYDGKSLTNINESDGLCNNAVNCILEDNKGNTWFATHHNGVCRWDGKSFDHLSTDDGIEGSEAWDLYLDNLGNIWFPTEGFGVYRYGGSGFTNFHDDQGLASDAVQCTFQDKDGRLWVGGYQGLFYFDGESFLPATRKFLMEFN